MENLDGAVRSEQEPVSPSAGDQSSTPTNAPSAEKAQPKKSRRGLAPPRSFPVHTLERALAVAKAIKEKNAGNPWPPTEVAKAVGISERSSTVDILFRSASMYGLSTGTRSATSVNLDKIGRDIVYAPNHESEVLAKRNAFLNVELFSKVLEYYKGNNLPEMSFLSNTLSAEFNVPKEYHEEFAKLFRENCEFTGIGREWSGLSTPVSSLGSGEFRQSPSIVAHSPEHAGDGKKCFVIMPFSERLSKRPKGFFDEVFESLIKPAAEAAGFEVYTANKDGSDVIQSTIINELMDAELVVADLTDHNPNVLFELGIRLAQEKPTAIIKTSDTGGIFDVDSLLRVFEYSENMWPSTVRHDVPRLEGHIKATWDNRNASRSYVAILRSKA